MGLHVTDESAATDDGAGEGRLVRSAFAMLRVLGRMQGPVGVSRLAAAVGIPKTTAHRLLEQMARENIVERRERKWVLAVGFHDLDRRDRDLSSIARQRLYAMTRATGATLSLCLQSADTLRPLASTCGRLTTQVMTAVEQTMAPRHPASAMWEALETGRLCAEHRVVHPECCCIAMPFVLPSGDIAVLGLALPDHRAVESLKRPLDKMASLILEDVSRWESQLA
ncbi:helix-turn-helix domain-containing protein [Mycobacterium montefiorense]|uniref:helix-turn-helix domain-containing protein n=1 Tax=Mycobacterium montefiorense TaxID=154654 RepID=UPI0021F25AB6|nr:helix-turn-helix domain-containing protein [Mycobacterium montefiorense]MCV7426184.1 helix-turn-helix domain-containing protein [Mycobacterium montefiorense]